MRKKKTKKVVLIPFDIRNGNGRIYTKTALKKVIKELQKKISELGVLFGELGYPDSFDTTLSNVSHEITKIWIEKNKLMGNIRPLNTKSGKILSEHINDYVFRPRSTGVVGENGIIEIKKLFTFDAILKKNDAWNSE